MKKSLM